MIASISRCRRSTLSGGITGKIETRQDVEGDERGNTLPVGRYFQDFMAGEVRRDRLYPGRLGAGEIFKRQKAAALAQFADDVLGDRACIEGIAALLRRSFRNVRARPDSA